MAFGRFVAAITTTLGFPFGFFSSPSSSSSPSPSFSPSGGPSSFSSSPSININSVATTLLSTSPPSSRFGANASTSSITITAGLFRFASAKTSRRRASVSPW